MPKSHSHDSHYTIKKSPLPTGLIKVEKVLLNLAYTDFGNSSGPDFIATFEIVLTNDTSHKIMNVSIKDSMLGFKAQVGGPTTGGELRPYFTNVDVLDTSSTLTPLPFNQVILGNGELVNTGTSYLAPASITRLLVRIGGRGFLISESPSTGAPGATERSKLTMLLQGSCVVSGFVSFGGCDIVPIFPVYARTGILNGFTMRGAVDELSVIPSPFNAP